MRKKTLACQVDIAACHIIIFMPKIKPEVFDVIMRNHVGGRKCMAQKMGMDPLDTGTLL